LWRRKSKIYTKTDFEIMFVCSLGREARNRRDVTLLRDHCSSLALLKGKHSEGSRDEAGELLLAIAELLGILLVVLAPALVGFG
jgi:hypothetical protein